MEITKEHWREKYLKLPQDLKDAIFSVDTTEVIGTIGKKYGLLIDKVGLLADEVGFVMIGVTHPKDFIPNLVERLGVDQMTTKNIAEEVNEQIFKKVRESLMKIHGITEQKAPEAPKPEPKPLEIRPVPAAPPPGMAFEEKTREEVFRTPAETREKIEPKKNMQEVEFKDIKKEIKSDPYREAIE